MKKMITSLFLSFILMILMGVTAFAAPKVMADGGIFDAEYYAQTNPDVVVLVGNNEIDLYNHYLQYGKAEGRLPYAPVVGNNTGANTVTSYKSASPTQNNQKTGNYVLNTNTYKFHKPSCSSVNKMSEKNKKVVDWSRQEIINAGYEACKVCKP